jgi:hypothetical protein
MPSVISANRLEDGTVAYLTADGSWAGSLAAAKLFAAETEVAAGLAEARHAVQRNIVLDPLIVEVSDAPTGRRATSLRNSIRATGPTVRYAALVDRDEPESNQSNLSDVFISVVEGKNLEQQALSSLRNLHEPDRAGKAARRPTFPHSALEAARS